MSKFTRNVAVQAFDLTSLVQNKSILTRLREAYNDYYRNWVPANSMLDKNTENSYTILALSEFIFLVAKVLSINTKDILYIIKAPKENWTKNEVGNLNKDEINLLQALREVYNHHAECDVVTF